MTIVPDAPAESVTPLPAPGRALPWMTILFVGSGCAALIYEVVWLQMLQLVIGSSAVSLGVLLGTFMGGMCLGSFFLPRFISTRSHPLRVYAALEFLIGLCGLGLLYGMPLVGPLYSAHVGSGLGGHLLRGLIAAVCLLPPTVLMGATLPAIARSVDATPEGVSWLGFFYGANIAGAVCGCLLAGFYLLRVFDMAIATYVAAIINAEVAVVAFLMAARIPHAVSEPGARLAWAAAVSGRWRVYLAIGISGLCALGAEVIWTRLLSLLLGGTVYTFSIILAVFLVGLGIGSTFGSWFSATIRRPRLALGVSQLLLVLTIAWTAWQLTRSLPYWPIKPSLSASPWFIFQLDLVRCLWAILPAACLWGASFPLALAGAAAAGEDPGRLVGRVYAANTIGAIAGALLFSVVLIGWWGTQQSQRLLVALSALSAMLVLVPLLWHGAASAAGSVARRVARRVVAAAAVGSVAGLVSWVAWKVPEVPGELIAYGRNVPTETGKSAILYQGEGMNSSVAVSMLIDGTRCFHVSGKVEASSEPQDMRLQKLLAHIPALLHPAPKTVLVVGCGAGVTAGSFLAHPEVERVVICEIEPLIPTVVASYFKDENHNVIAETSRVKVEYDDARHYILTTHETFDIITSDPIHPWVKGAATLYTKEYFELCRRRLNPGGLLTQWVPLYESKPDAVKSELVTLFSVFPEGSVWGNANSGRGYDTVVLAQTEPLRVDVDRLIDRLNRDDHQKVAVSLHDAGFLSALDLLACFAGEARDLAPWLADAHINHDRNLRLQYLAGMGLNQYDEAIIYDQMLAHRKYPEAIFVASARSRAELMLKLGAFKSPN